MEINTMHRTLESEIMDDLFMEGEELRVALDQIAKINRILGGNSVTLNGVKQLLKNADKSKTITIADIGCGNGDMLRMLSEFGESEGYKFKLLGIDANRFTINYARELSEKFSDVEYQCLDIFSGEFSSVKYDIALCTLTLHHFKDDEILKIISIFNQNAGLGTVINDLHRSRAAYSLFNLISSIFRMDKMSREDGLVSILRGFKKNELKQFAESLNLKKSSIRWRWAFRYQWIISKI